MFGAPGKLIIRANNGDWTAVTESNIYGVKPQAAQAHYLWVRASEVIWWEYTRIISVLSDAK